MNILLGLPELSFDAIHVVGTNGKSSVTRMIAALLEAHGISAGAYLSPHARRWTERVLIRGEEIPAEEFAAVAEKASICAEVVDFRTKEEGNVTQFEFATAVAFAAFARAGVEVGVVEAGLGGRLDATATLRPRITVLTSVGLDHTEWLGETEEEIATEKLAVLREKRTLVVGRLSAAVMELAERTAREREAKLIVAPEDPGPSVALRAAGRFQRRNFALAMAAVEAYFVDRRRLKPQPAFELRADLVAAVAEGLGIPGRLEPIGTDPLVYLDAAHNPDGAAALAQSLPELAAGRPVFACLAMLADKDAVAAVAALAPALERAVCSELPAKAIESRGLPGAASRPAAELVAACREAGLEAEAEPDFAAAVRLIRELAGKSDGIALIAGSHYALAPAREALGLCED